MSESSLHVFSTFGWKLIVGDGCWLCIFVFEAIGLSIEFVGLITDLICGVWKEKREIVYIDK